MRVDSAKLCLLRAASAHDRGFTRRSSRCPSIFLFSDLPELCLRRVRVNAPLKRRKFRSLASPCALLIFEPAYPSVFRSIVYFSLRFLIDESLTISSAASFDIQSARPRNHRDTSAAVRF